MKIPNQTIICIAGASASGKTLFAETIFDEMLSELGADQITLLREDAYYRNQDHIPLDLRTETNYDHPSAFEHELLIEHLQKLGEGQSIETPNYCFVNHTRKSETSTVNPSRVILVEGIMLLSDAKLRELFDIKIFMDTPLDICLIRRIKRDLIERGRSFESITQQYTDTVRPMYHEFIEPAKHHADIVITKGGKNRMAIEVLKAKIRQLTQI